MGPDAMILVFWMLSFKPTFWLSSFTFMKRLFSSSSLHSKQKNLKCSSWYNIKNDRMISIHFQGKPFNITVIQVYTPITNAQEAEVESPILWPPDAKSWLIGTDLDAGKDWGQGEKGMTEDEMVGWHHWLNGPEFEQALGVGDGQGSLVCCSPWGCKELNITERNKYFTVYI